MASLHELWAALRSSETSETAGDLRMRLCFSALDLRVFAAVAGARREAAIVLEIPRELLPRNLDASSGRRFELIAAELPGLPAGRGAVVVQLRDDQFEDLFEQLGTCLIAEIRASSSASEAIRGAVRQIERWRRFLERHRQTLSPEEVRGLIGELTILERLMVRIGARAALSSWKAPAGSIRDFECPDETIEVKTYMHSTGVSVRINDPLQLEPEAGLALVLACQELAHSTLDQLTLPGHVARLTAHLGGDAALREDFENALASAGYLASQANLYQDGFALGTLRAFEVRRGFPRIRAADIPAAVSFVQFSLDILPLASFAVDADARIGPAPA